jgi:hypothetical protein
LGFFLAAIPWYTGAFLLFFVALDHKEKPGLIACTIAVSIPFALLDNRYGFCYIILGVRETCHCSLVIVVCVTHMLTLKLVLHSIMLFSPTISFT